MSVSGIQRQTLDGLHEKMNDLEATLSRERDEHKRDIVSIINWRKMKHIFSQLSILTPLW